MINYKSELINKILEERGHEMSTLHYESECIETWINEEKGGYPKLTDYESEWLNYIIQKPVGIFPYETIIDVTDATVDNVVPYAYKSAILTGSTKYRDIDSGEILDVFDETKNLELVSVKMPVLTTTGKNVFDGDNSMELGAWGEKGAPFVTSSEIRCKNNFTPFPKGLKNGDVMYIVLSDTSINSNTNMHVYDESKTKIATLGYDSTPYIEGTDFINGVSTVTIHNASKCKYFSFRVISTNTECKFAIMVNTSAPYEPYKSIILTVNEDVELRGIGEGSNRVEDELNCLTGEVAERVGEMVFNGSEAWFLSADPTTNLYFRLNVPDILNQETNVNIPLVLSDKYPGKTQDSIVNKKQDGICSQWTGHQLVVKDSTVSTVDEFKAKLSQSPMTINYIMDTPTIKTVDLMVIDQDGNTLSQIKPLEGIMHISTDGTPLRPTVSMEIPVEAITQNLSSFIEED